MSIKNGCIIYPIISKIVQSKNVEDTAIIVKFFTSYSLPSPIALPMKEFTVVWIPFANIEKNMFIEKNAP